MPKVTVPKGQVVGVSAPDDSLAPSDAWARSVTEWVIARLNTRKGQFAMIAEQAGVDFSWLHRLAKRRGRVAQDPPMRAILGVYRWLKANL